MAVPRWLVGLPEWPAATKSFCNAVEVHGDGGYDGGWHGDDGYHAWYGAQAGYGVGAGFAAGRAFDDSVAVPHYGSPDCGYYPDPPCY